MPTVQAICDGARRKFKLPPGDVHPEVLAKLCKLRLRPVSFAERPGLYGTDVVFSDTVPRAAQLYQIARACGSWILLGVGELRAHSPHEVAIGMCGVTSADEQAQPEDAPVVVAPVAPAVVPVTVAPVIELRARGRKPSSC